MSEPNRATLLRKPVSALSGWPLPPVPDRRRIVAEALSPMPADAPDAPPGQPEAICAALTRVLVAWGRGGHETLSVEEMTELYLLTALLRAAPDTAGALAQLFRHPETVLDMRDTTLRLAFRRASFDRQRAAYEATEAAWNSRGKRPEPALGIRTLPAPDPDLWHRVVVEHDRTDAEQRAAALWCVRQTGCDRATVALYLSFLAADGTLQAAASRGDRVFLEAILDVIRAWNAGEYRVQELALDPPDAVAADGARFSEALGQLAAITGEGRWPEPCGAFTEYHGRMPRRRAHWCLRSGSLVQPPDPADYAFRPEHIAA